MSTETSAPSATRVSLVAPITGVLMPIEQVPDPVFAQKMVGEGMSIDPLSNTLVAPCDGEVIHIHPAAHALTIRSADGLEVLTHIGLDTVHMKGEGFTVKVKVGDQVHAGDELITFDLDAVATNAKSLLTQMVIANSDLLSDFAPGSGVVTAGQRRGGGGHARRRRGCRGRGQAGGRKVTSDAILVPNPVGLHARPAAVLSNLAAQYESDVSLKRGEDQANAKSVMAIMGMEVRYGDKVQVVAYGPDAERGGRRARRPDRRRPRRGGRRRRSPRPAPNRSAAPVAGTGRPGPAPPLGGPQRAARGRRLAGAWRRHRRADPARGLRGHRGLQRPPPRASQAQRRHRPVHGPARGAARTG